MTKIECPKCKKEPTGKYRDEVEIDGMYCRPCGIAWNIDWEEQKPLYDTAIEIDDGSGDAERKLTKEEMDVVLPKFIDKLKRKKTDNEEK